MINNYDLVIVGAGPVGCVIAERAANLRGWSSLIIDKRNHIAGNCYDRYHESGLLIHQYGPHYFRTNNESLFAYLSKFTDWVPGNYFVKSFSQGQYFPFPINLNTLETFFSRTFTPSDAENFLEEQRIKVEVPKNSEEFVLSRVGREMYEAFYLGYTLKQWGVHPRDLAASVCGRIPIRLNRDERYVDHKHQVTPANGFTELFKAMISNNKISTLLQTDYRAMKQLLKPRIATVYCGPADEYFDYKLGKLPWRSLAFEFKTYQKEYIQPCVQINYPNDFLYTRSVEIKHVTKQQHANTIISFEYPKADGDPYYPVPAEANERLFADYAKLIEQEKINKSVYFAGRLARYKYLNMDEAMESALATFDEISQKNL